MDKIDKRIISILEEKPSATLTEIGKIIGISHVAVRKRVQRLISSGFMKMVPAFNIDQLKYKIAVILAEVGDPKHLNELFSIFKDCPRMMFLSTSIGRYNVFSMMYAEDDDTLESVISFCSFRTHKLIRKSEVIVLCVSEVPKYIPLNIADQRSLKVAPCGVRCDKCTRYKDNKCRGCPATVYYREATFGH